MAWRKRGAVVLSEVLWSGNLRRGFDGLRHGAALEHAGRWRDRREVGGALRVWHEVASVQGRRHRELEERARLQWATRRWFEWARTRGEHPVALRVLAMADSHVPLLTAGAGHTWASREEVAELCDSVYKVNAVRAVLRVWYEETCAGRRAAHGASRVVVWSCRRAVARWRRAARGRAATRSSLVVAARHRHRGVKRRAVGLWVGFVRAQVLRRAEGARGGAGPAWREV